MKEWDDPKKHRAPDSRSLLTARLLGWAALLLAVLGLLAIIYRVSS